MRRAVTSLTRASLSSQHPTIGRLTTESHPRGDLVRDSRTSLDFRLVGPYLPPFSIFLGLAPGRVSCLRIIIVPSIPAGQRGRGGVVEVGGGGWAKEAMQRQRRRQQQRTIKGVD